MPIKSAYGYTPTAGGASLSSDWAPAVAMPMHLCGRGGGTIIPILIFNSARTMASSQWSPCVHGYYSHYVVFPHSYTRIQGSADVVTKRPQGYVQLKASNTASCAAIC